MGGRTGRTPMPTALRVLRGETRPSRLNRNEPKLPRGAQRPAWLPPPACVEWDRLAPLLDRAGVLTVGDADALALVCTMLVGVKQAIAEGRGVDPRALSELRAWLGQFGMTPASRSKVTAVEVPKASKLARFLR